MHMDGQEFITSFRMLNSKTVLFHISDGDIYLPMTKSSLGVNNSLAWVHVCWYTTLPQWFELKFDLVSSTVFWVSVNCTIKVHNNFSFVICWIYFLFHEEFLETLSYNFAILGVVWFDDVVTYLNRDVFMMFS